MTTLAKLWRNLSPSRIGIIYVWVLLIAAFWVWMPDLFPTMSTVHSVVYFNALSGLAALAILVPMVSGAIDASVGGNIALSGIFCGWLFQNTHLPVLAVVLITLGIGATIGLVNAFVVVVLKIPPIIGTLATWLICDALSIAVAGQVSSLNPPQLSGTFGNYFALNSWQNFYIPILFVIVLATVLGVVLTQTPVGRHTYAVGLNPAVARNTGIRVARIQSCSLVIGGILGAFAGMVLTAQSGAAQPSPVGDQYLLPAFAAVFLGATQFRLKRFSAWGTVLAVFMLGTGVYGLQLAGAASWIPNIFQGVALIIAIGLSTLVFSRSSIAKGKSSRFKSSAQLAVTRLRLRRVAGQPETEAPAGVGLP